MSQLTQKTTFAALTLLVGGQGTQPDSTKPATILKGSGLGTQPKLKKLRKSKPVKQKPKL